MTLRTDARLPVVALVAGLALGYAVAVAWPPQYAASASVLLPGAATSGSRIVRIQHAAGDPQRAAASVQAQLSLFRSQNAKVLDSPTVVARRPSLAMSLAIGGGAGLAAGSVLLVARLRRRRPVRNERELIRALGEPLLAARPLRPDCVRPLCEQLLAHWFTARRHLLPIVGAGSGEGRSRVAAQLAVAFAKLGHRTLLIDGDFRAPSLHRAFDLPNRHGLADFLRERRVSLASAGENLSIMVAGAPRADPLDLLSRQRLQAFLAETRKHFRVVLIDTPAAEQGPDFQMYAALAGGVLAVTHARSTDSGALAALHAALERCAARLVTTVIRQD